MKKTIARMAILILLLVLSTACQQQSKETTRTPLSTEKKRVHLSPQTVKKQVDREPELSEKADQTVRAADFNEGKNINKITMISLTDGKRHSLGSVIKGRVAVIDFWSTWCRPCVLQLPDLQHIHTHYVDVAVISISLSPSRDKAKSVLREQKVTFPAFTADADLMNDGIILPQTVIVNSQGNVVAVSHGRHTVKELEQMIKEAGKK